MSLASFSVLRDLLRDLSIRTKLLILATTSVAMALGLAFAGMAANDIGLIKKSKLEQLHSQAKMLAYNSVGVLAFQNEKATQELLASMAMYPTIEYACVFDEAGEVFAEFKSSPEIQSPKPALSSAGAIITGSSIEVIEGVSDGGQKLGAVYLHSNMTDLDDHIHRYLSICSAIMACSLIGAAVFALFLQGAISSPINELARVACTVKDERDYSVRVNPTSNDELGQLSFAFNDMLDEIQSSKAALQKAHDELESKVEERTYQLREEIEQRKSVQSALELARDGAEAASRAKSEFLANMSHEIRTPLNGILGFTELLCSSNEPLDPVKNREYLDTISTSGQHLLALINDILDLSKIEAGQMEVELSPVSPHDVINQVVSVLRARAQQKGLLLKCKWSSSVPESIVTDGARLRQLLMNLVGNAIKFTQTGTVSVEARLDHFSETLSVRVVDTGIGIAKEKQSDIFDPFVQADNSVTRRYGGTGLGLAICKRIASALGGGVWVESTEGRGSVFTLSIKTGSLKEIELLDAPPADALMSASCHDSADSNPLPPCKILLVEDGEVNRKLVQIMLTEAGADVTTAENGWVGVQLASKKQFDLILMDMQMPIMDGYTATQQLRAQGIDIPILALTAHAMKGDDSKCLEAGCTAYLTKPIQAHRLINTVSEYLRISMSVKEVIEVSSENPSRGKESNLSSTAKQASYDPSCFVSSLPLNNPVYLEIVNEFVDTLQGHIDDMRSAYGTQDFDSLARLAHGLKGAGGTAGFDILTAPAATLQKCSKDPEVEEIAQALEELSEMIQLIQATPQVARARS